MIGSWLGNGFGGFGGGWNRGSVGVGYDTGAINAMQGQLNSISNQINAADRDFLMQTANQNQFLQIIEESAVQIINNNNLNDKDLLFYMYQKGFEFMQKQTDQNLIDLGSIGLAYAIKRTK